MRYSHRDTCEKQVQLVTYDFACGHQKKHSQIREREREMSRGGEGVSPSSMVVAFTEGFVCWKLIGDER